MNVWAKAIRALSYICLGLGLGVGVSIVPVSAQTVGPDGKTIGNIPIGGPNAPRTQFNIAPPAAPQKKAAPQQKPVVKKKKIKDKDLQKILGVGQAIIELNRQIKNGNNPPPRGVRPPPRQVVVPNRGNRPVFYNASFKCRGKLNKTEYAICTNRKLAKMDLVLADLYRLSRRDGVPGIRRSQNKWLVNRNNRCGRNVSCLLNMYAARIDELNAPPPQPRRVVQPKAPAPSPAPSPSQNYSRLVNYTCSNGADFQVRYEGDSRNDYATLIMAGVSNIRLDGQPSGSGALYSDGGISWHTKSRDGVLSQLGYSLNCGER